MYLSKNNKLLVVLSITMSTMIFFGFSHAIEPRGYEESKESDGISKLINGLQAVQNPEHIGLNMSEERFKNVVKYLKEFSEALANYYNYDISKVEEQVRNSNKTIVVVGNTGVGKSTLVNALTKVELEAELARGGGAFYKLKDPSKGGCWITRGSRSETSLPAAAIIGDLCFVDLPGLRDTRSSGHMLVNAVYIARILQAARNLGFLFVISQNDLEAERGKPVDNVLNVMTGLLSGAKDDINQTEEELRQKGMERLTDVSALVITRCNSQDQEAVIYNLQENLSPGGDVRVKDEDSVRRLNIINQIFRINDYSGNVWPFHNCGLFFSRNKEFQPELMQESLDYTVSNVTGYFANKTRKTDMKEINISSLLPRDIADFSQEFFKVLTYYHFREFTVPQKQLEDIDSYISPESLEDSLKEISEKLGNEGYFQALSTEFKALKEVKFLTENRYGDPKIMETMKKNFLEAKRHAEKREKVLYAINERQKFKKTAAYRELVQQIDTSFHKFRMEKKAYEDYNDSLCWYDPLTFGLSYLAGKVKKLYLESEVDDLRKQLGSLLKTYNSKMYQKHPRHDEIVHD